MTKNCARTHRAARPWMCLSFFCNLMNIANTMFMINIMGTTATVLTTVSNYSIVISTWGLVV